MTIAKGVGDVFLEDDDSFYYTDKNDSSTLKVINRKTRKSKELCSLEYTQIFNVFDDGDSVTIAGGEGVPRVLVDPVVYKVSKETNESGSISVTKLDSTLITRDDGFGYKTSVEIVGQSFLRTSVSEVNLIAKNGTIVKLESESGYVSNVNGRMAIHKNDQDKYVLGYYSAEDGSFIEIADVNEEYSVWTSTYGQNGRVYYIDLNSETGNKELRSVLADGSKDVKVEKVFDKGQFNIDLNQTGAATMNSTMIFYSYSGDDIQVEYRYDIK